MLGRALHRLRRELDRRERLARLPKRVLLLITIPRSGGTLLFDALRCHPSLHLMPEADLFVALGFNGRRYPADLKGDSRNAIEIEVRPERWEPLPRFALPAALTSPARRCEPYALERAHPHFFDFDASEFARRLKPFQSEGAVRVIYQVRDPAETIVSFLSYKERKPEWNAHVAPEDVLPLMRRTYTAISACAAAVPGRVVDYRALENDVTGTLRDIFAWLWPGKGPTSDEQLLREIEEATRRDSRGETPFFWPPAGEPKDVSRYQSLFDAYAADFERCMLEYGALAKVAETTA